MRPRNERNNRNNAIVEKVFNEVRHGLAGIPRAYAGVVPTSPVLEVDETSRQVLNDADAGCCTLLRKFSDGKFRAVS